MDNDSVLDINEVISTLSRSSLPTVIIEGVDDVVVYRILEDIFSDFGISVLPVHGRKNVLKVFDRLNEIENREQVAFIADRDLWVISGIPVQYTSSRLIFTDGYSIENDIFRDSGIRNLMRRIEREKFEKDVEKYSHWYALTVKRTLENSHDVCIKTYPGILFDNASEYSRQIELRDNELYPDEILETVKSDIEKYIRGKSLMQIASRQLNCKGRDIKINPTVFLGIAPSKPGPLLSDIFAKVGSIFSIQPCLGDA